jgi:Uma2 family endonuclease
LYPLRRVESSALLLAIEVLSPSTARYDRITKRRLYQELQIEYWIVDLDARVIERWRPGDERPEMLADRIEWVVPGHAVTWTLDLEAFFAAVLDP